MSEADFDRGSIAPSQFSASAFNPMVTDRHQETKKRHSSTIFDSPLWVRVRHTDREDYQALL